METVDRYYDGRLCQGIHTSCGGRRSRQRARQFDSLGEEDKRAFPTKQHASTNQGAGGQAQRSIHRDATIPGTTNRSESTIDEDGANFADRTATTDCPSR